jgi:hypothetical protein
MRGIVASRIISKSQLVRDAESGIMLFKLFASGVDIMKLRLVQVLQTAKD